MLRRTICTLMVLLFTVTLLAAAEYTGTVEKIDTKKGALTIKMKDDKTKDFDITFKAKVFDKEGKESTGKKRLAILTKETSVTVTTDDKDVVTSVKINK